MKASDLAHIRELACALRDSRFDDGQHLGPTDVAFCAMALERVVHSQDRLRRLPSVLAIVGIGLFGLSVTDPGERIVEVAGASLARMVSASELAEAPAVGSTSLVVEASASEVAGYGTTSSVLE